MTGPRGIPKGLEETLSYVTKDCSRQEEMKVKYRFLEVIFFSIILATGFNNWPNKIGLFETILSKVELRRHFIGEIQLEDPSHIRAQAGVCLYYK